MGLLACMSRRLGEDAIHLAATLRYVSVAGPEDVYRHCSPDERLMLETVRHRVAVAESLGEIMDFLFESTRREQDCDRMSLMFLEDGGSRAVSYWTRTSYTPLILPADYKEDLAGVSSKSRSIGRSTDRQRPRAILPRPSRESCRATTGSRGTPRDDRHAADRGGKTDRTAGPLIPAAATPTTNTTRCSIRRLPGASPRRSKRLTGSNSSRGPTATIRRSWDSSAMNCRARSRRW